MILRDYQKRDLADIWAQFQQGCRRVCHVMPTAGGKTVVFVSLLAWLAAKGYRIVMSSTGKSSSIRHAKLWQL
jgi:superfamily II DNA or RNA helicase